MSRVFPDREEAGRMLAERFAELPQPPPPGATRVVVLAVGDEGRAVAGPVAARAGAPLGLYRVVDLVLPWRPKVAFGAITDDNHHYIDPEIVAGPMYAAARATGRTNLPPPTKIIDTGIVAEAQRGL